MTTTTDSLGADTPAATSTAAEGTNLLVNGSFEDNGLNGADRAHLSSLPGWTEINGGDFDVWAETATLSAADGSTMLELDSRRRHDGFYQDVNTTAGQTYTLTFEARQFWRDSTDTSAIEILWNGEVVGTFTPSSKEFETFTLTVTGTGGADRLTVREPLSQSADGRGALVDNFSLVADGDISDGITYIDDTYTGRVYTGTSEDDHIINLNTNISDIYGGDGDDIIEDTATDAWLLGDAGNDTLINTQAYALFNGGAGNDTMIAGDSFGMAVYDHGTPLTVQIDGTTYYVSEGDIYVDTLTNINRLILSNVDDTFSVTDAGSFTGFFVEGWFGNDIISGGRLGDVLHGGEDDDTIAGNAGDDLITGGSGVNTLTGGTGADLFGIESNYNRWTSNINTITDFSDADALSMPHYGDYEFIADANFSGNGHEVRAYTSGKDTIVEVDVNGDGTANTTMVLLDYTDGLTLTTSFDFSNDVQVDPSPVRSDRFLIATPTTPEGTNLLVNGSFEDNSLDGADRGHLASLPGWAEINGGDFDVWAETATLSAADGSTMLELDSRRRHDGFYQDVTTTEGQTYTLTFEARQFWRDSTDTSAIEILWNGEVVGTFTPSSKEFETFTLTVTGTGGADRLTVREPLSQSADGRGALVDNFSLVADTTEPANTAPVAVDDTASAETGTQAILDVLANDTDTEGDALSITHINGVALALNETLTLTDGSVVVNLGTSIGLTATVSGEISLSYTVSDGELSDDGTVLVSVTGNTAPVAVDDTLSFRAGRSQWINVLDNDHDTDGNRLSITHVNGEAIYHEMLIDLQDGSQIRVFGPNLFLLTPYDFDGEVSFNYTVNDGLGGIDEATSTITVIPDTAPVAVDDYAEVRSGESVTIHSTYNDYDADLDHLTITHINGQRVAARSIIDLGGGNQVELIAVSILSISAAEDFEGSLSFTYTVDDGYGATDSATVTVDVTQNHAPEAVDDVSTVTSGTQVMVPLFSNDYDANGDSLYLTYINGQSFDSAVPIDLGNGNQVQIDRYHGRAGFISSPDFVGEVSFNYSVSDGHGGTDTATVTFEVIAPDPNTPPRAVDDLFSSIYSNGTLAIDPTRNDFDADADTLIITHINDVAVSGDMLVDIGEGNLVHFNNGSIEFIAGYDYYGESVFRYTISDGNGGTDQSRATIPVDYNQEPVAVNDTLTAISGHTHELDIRQNDSDPDGDNLRVTHINGQLVTPENSMFDIEDGNKVYISNGRVYIDCAIDFVGNVSFSYTVFDGKTKSDSATAFVDVVENTAPIATDDAQTAREGQTIIFDPTYNDFDSNGDALFITHINGIAVGANEPQTLDDGSVVEIVDLYTGRTNLLRVTSSTVGDLNFTYTVSDGAGGSDTAMATVTVTPNTAPVANDDTIAVVAGTSVTFELMENDTDADGDTLSIDQIDGQEVQFGDTIDLGNGNTATVYSTALQINAATDFYGDIEVNYTVSDGFGGTDEATASITVRSNDAPQATDDEYALSQNTFARLDVLSNDLDLDSDELEIVAINGRYLDMNYSIAIDQRLLIVINRGSYLDIYDGFNAPEGQYSFSYTVSDGYSENTAFVTIDLTENPNDLIANNAETTFTLAVGETHQSSVDYSGDKDWYAVELEAGETYTFALDGTENGNSSALTDSYLILFDVNGTRIAENDNANGTLFSELTFAAVESGTFYVSAGGFLHDTGGYEISMELVSPPEQASALSAKANDTLVSEWLAHTTGESISYDMLPNDASPPPLMFDIVGPESGDLGKWQLDDFGFDVPVDYLATSEWIDWADVDQFVW